MSLQHLHLHVADRPRAERFYADWFGLRAKRRGDDITFMHDDRAFLLALMDDAAPAPMPPWFHFGMRVASAADVLDLHRRMEAASVPIRKGVFESTTLTSFRCADPDGYVIEVYWDA
jgi:catechol-2,3-dioxygenase